MASVKDMKIGDVFDKLVIIDDAPRTKSGGKMYKCLCKCGNIKNVRAQSLIEGITKTCGIGVCRSRESDEALPGIKFNKLTIIEQIGYKPVGKLTWIRLFVKCACDCGGTTELTYRKLKSGAVKSCGCLRVEGNKRKRQHNIGDHINNFTIINEAGYDKGRRLVECKCGCGNNVILLVTRLSEQLSCGCMRYKPPKRDFVEDDIWKREYAQYIKNSDKRNISFSLTIDECKFIWKQNCFYCGKEPHIKLRTKIKNDIFRNTIDRIDSYKGYLSDNCVPACKHCNRLKMKLSMEKFRELIIKIYNNFAKPKTTE